MTIAALIVAAGQGTRAGVGAPKQWRPLQDRRVIDWSIKAFRDFGIRDIVVVLNSDDPTGWQHFEHSSDINLVPGADERAGSVKNGLKALIGTGATKVLIHDGARPCLSQPLIGAITQALEHTPAAAPAVQITDALWRGADNQVTGTQDRDGLFAAQTPQGFDLDIITAAHETHPGNAADDVQVARDAGYDVHIVPGDPNNIKITRPEDFARAAQILNKTQQVMEHPPVDIRLGNGYDVHRFGDGDHVILCGVKIPHERGLQGHSDADVGMHAVTDAIYGALARGDIGQHFPPSDPQWKGAASDIFLHHAADMARGMGFQISNVDCTLVCEHPKVGPHALHMRQAMAEILEMDIDRVSIKATTSERLGFTGRKEGIAALATASLIKRS
ncbi:bifunctional 2-C-methyl-D-erythritol 4-phosphate cytidylyltransferase/2-C-methyl-D-erythritol 2,4-cyclodiphosphate synthase [Epibacterium ulvae]|uniref:bifunctional 2-C-methyl-D-erythritol 4-phosphate cytidylyltransferase/2-C-methyl-D-erythritol 2,4-cyclodiphosphate synthase n=1 Tax=Epibacterium ulvae TaxID=1156985 RepID=UPI001BFC0D54|nr:bifunctional 2-C-methyl-D-erythritol 4-phosphate cytidylyltransferase/2-C-methyl-D-erythritol 2,4-cyclodiphosphate synthase [Epibacterium ulvae]MBT8154384.1 bifunctional 2-C-methyl-D-erythritol 4-phosphate cytidylyltransferase/2-C-methyl-D-erythritol 2,4-cyclodiphosphate synthase [Epibacterium ulvae]